MDYIQIWEACVEGASVTGELVLSIRNEDKLEVFEKEDKSPVTNADYMADYLITRHLLEAFPNIPLISEEGELVPFPIHQDTHYFLIDPLDATRNYIKGQDNFTINISLMKGYHAVVGLIYAPVSKTLWSAVQGKGAYVQGADAIPAQLKVTGKPEQGIRAIAGSNAAMQSVEQWQQFCEGHTITNSQAVSSAIKFGLIASGDADLYLRLGKTCAWDTSAGQLLVEEAGGRMETVDGKRFSYQTTDFINPPFVVKGW